jgi:putative tryptophan/tyrosine transport system substrate-binding protein
MRRRDFIALIGGVTGAWPLVVRAQQPSFPVIGFLNASAAERNRDVVAAFEDGLKQTGYIPGKNVAIEYRWANDDYDRLPDLVQELVGRQVAVILAATPVAALAAKRAATHIPIVFCVGSDPVKDGLVTSLNRSSENITGSTFFSDLLTAKRLELLHELVHDSNVFGVLINPKNPNANLEIKDANEAAQSLALELVFADAANESEIEKSFLRFQEGRSAGLLVASDLFLNLHAKEIVQLALEYRLPTCFSFREPAAAGGLMAYGASRPDAYRRAANYVGRILHGENASSLPVQQPTKFEFVINLKTAKALGLTVPPSMQLLADEVIE